MSIPDAFISVCERYASNTATEKDIKILQSLSTNTPLPQSISPIQYGFNPDTRLPDDPTPFHITKNRIRESAHSARQKSQLAALHSYINNPITTESSFPDTLSSFPLQASAKQALREAIIGGCAVELRLGCLLLLDAEPFITAMRNVGFEVVLDNEDSHVVFTLTKGNDYVLLWKLLTIRHGNTLPAGEIRILAPRNTACASWLVRTVLKIV